MLVCYIGVIAWHNSAMTLVKRGIIMITLNLKKAVVRPQDRVATVLEKIATIELPYSNLVTEFVNYDGQLCLDEVYYKRDKSIEVAAGVEAPRDKKGRAFRLRLESLEKAGKGNAMAVIDAKIESLVLAKVFLAEYNWDGTEG